MTPAEFASLVNARQAGRGRWQAKCPAHPDSAPSLSISEGREGRVLVRCWAGCSLGSVLGALRLEQRDLFTGPAPSPAQLAVRRRENEAEAAVRHQHAEAERQLASIVRRLHLAAMVLGARLMRSPSDDDLAHALHTACDWLHVAEEGFDAAA